MHYKTPPADAIGLANERLTIQPAKSTGTCCGCPILSFYTAESAMNIVAGILDGYLQLDLKGEPCENSALRATFFQAGAWHKSYTSVAIAVTRPPGATAALLAILAASIKTLLELTTAHHTGEETCLHPSPRLLPRGPYSSSLLPHPTFQSSQPVLPSSLAQVSLADQVSLL